MQLIQQRLFEIGFQQMKSKPPVRYRKRMAVVALFRKHNQKFS